MIARMTAVMVILFLLGMQAMAAGAPTPSAWTIIPEAPAVLGFAGGRMVAARPLMQLLGGQVDVQDKKVAVNCHGITVRYTLGSTTAERAKGMARKKIELPLTPFLAAGEPYLPLDSLMAAFDGKVQDDTDHLGGTIALAGKQLHLTVVPLKIGPAEFRDTERELYLVALDGTDCMRLTYNEAPAELPAFSADGNAMVFARGGNLYLRKIDDPQAHPLLIGGWADGEHTYTTPVFTPDGQAILFTRADKLPEVATPRCMVGMVKPDGSGETVLMPGSNPSFPPGPAPAFTTVLTSPRGGAVALRDGGLPIGMLLLTIRRKMVTGLLRITQVGEEKLAIVLSDRYGIASGDRACPLTQCFSYLTTGTPQIGLAHPSLGAPLGFVPGFPCAGDAPSFMLTGTLAWSGTKNDIAKINYRASLADDPIVLTDGHAAAISPDGQSIVYLDDGANMMLVDVQTKKTHCLLPSWMGQLALPSFTPDGQTLLFLRSEQLCSVRSDGKQIHQLTKDITIIDYRLCPDGKHIVVLAEP